MIGNTGNARGGSPHLHFAVYKRGEGPLDPYPFVHEPPEKPREVAADISLLGARRRVSPRSADLRFSPEPEADVIRELPRYTLLSVVGASKDFFRVRLPDGAEGFVPTRATESVEKSVRQIGGSQPRTLRDRPGSAAAEIVTVAGGTSLPVLARFEGFLFVRAPGGRDGWVVEEESPAGR